jgi:predicted nucleic acid-binding protein
LVASSPRRARVPFVDAISFVLAKALRVREVLAFDGDFSAAGFVELCPHLAG